MLRIFVFISIILLSFSDAVANKKDALISELIELTRSQELYQYELELYQKSIDEIIKPFEKADENDLKEIEAFNKKMKMIISEEFSWNDYKHDCMKIYSEVYNLNEIEEMISYYKTSIGKQAIEKVLELRKRIVAISFSRRITILEKVRQLTRELAFKAPATESKPENRAILYLLAGNEFLSKKEYLLAINSYNMAIDMNPNDFQAYNNLAWLLSACPDKQLRNGQKALELAKKAYSLNQEVYVIDTLAAAYAEVGEYAKAASILREVITQLKNSGAKETEIELYSTHLNEIENSIK